MLDSEKICNHCSELKPRSAFSSDRNKKDGLHTICKVCRNRPRSTEEKAALAERQRNLRKKEKWKKYYAEYAKKWRKTDKGKAYVLLVGRQMADRHPLKYKARRLVNEAIRSGLMTNLPCFTCGELKVEAHHPDYDSPLDVIWLCNKHHNEVHHAKP